MLDGKRIKEFLALAAQNEVGDNVLDVRGGLKQLLHRCRRPVRRSVAGVQLVEGLGAAVEARADRMQLCTQVHGQILCDVIGDWVSMTNPPLKYLRMSVLDGEQSRSKSCEECT